MPTVKENLIAAKALIDTPEKWHRGSLNEGGCFCAMGAIGEVVTTDDGWIAGTAEFHALEKALPPGVYGIPTYNDHPDTTHADIMALFDRAIAAAE